MIPDRAPMGTWSGFLRSEWKGLLALLLVDALFVVVVLAAMVGLNALTEMMVK